MNPVDVILKLHEEAVDYADAGDTLNLNRVMTKLSKVVNQEKAESTGYEHPRIKGLRRSRPWSKDA